METRNTGYNVFQAAVLQGRLDRENLEHSLRHLIKRHESFRTSCKIIDNQAVQYVHPDVPFEIEYYDLAADIHRQTRGEWQPAAGSPQPEIAFINSFIRPFDLTRAPLLRVGLIKIHDDHHLLMLDLHHIISDGVSIGIFFREFMALYGREELPPSKLQYRDYSQWQNSPAEQTVLRQQETYWLEEFQGEPPVLELPLDYNRPEIQGFAGSEIEFQLGREESAALKALAREQDVTLYMILLALFYVLLARLSGQEDIIIGTPIEGRPHPDLQKIMGFFVNTLALRGYPGTAKTFNSFLAEVKERVLKAFAHQKYQFEDLVDKVAVNRDMSRNPLFCVVFNFLNIDVPDVRIPGLKLSQYNRENKTAKFDLTLKGVDAGNHLLFLFEYNTELFKAETIRRFIDHLKMIINQVIQNPDLEIAGIRITSVEKRKQLISRLSDDLEMDAAPLKEDQI
jgi:tyrocidine synthetase-3